MDFVRTGFSKYTCIASARADLRIPDEGFPHGSFNSFCDDLSAEFAKLFGGVTTTYTHGHWYDKHHGDISNEHGVKFEIVVETSNNALLREQQIRVAFFTFVEKYPDLKIQIVHVEKTPVSIMHFDASDEYVCRQ